MYTKIQMLYTLFEFLFCYNINRPQRRSCSEEYEDDSDSSENNGSNSAKKNKASKRGGIVIKEVNKTQSILIHCKLDADQFESYEYFYSKERFTIGINLSNLLKCIGYISPVFLFFAK